MDFELIKVRFISFLYQAGAFLAVAVLGALISPEFRDILAQNAGDGTVGMIILMVFDGLVKHVRNVVLIKKYEEKVGAGDSERVPPLLI